MRPELLLSLVVAACLLVQAVVAKNVLDVELDFFSQFAALWVYIAYLVTGLRDRSSSIAFAFAAIGVTAAVLALYAL
jgi:hypothetical protein